MPGDTAAPPIGRLVITRVGAFGVARPAPIDSIAVHSASPDDPAATVLRYRRGAQPTGGRGIGYYTGSAQTVLVKPVIGKPVIGTAVPSPAV